MIWSVWLLLANPTWLLVGFCSFFSAHDNLASPNQWCELRYQPKIQRVQCPLRNQNLSTDVQIFKRWLKLILQLLLLKVFTSIQKICILYYTNSYLMLSWYYPLFRKTAVQICWISWTCIHLFRCTREQKTYLTLIIFTITELWVDKQENPQKLTIKQRIECLNEHYLTWKWTIQNRTLTFAI